MKKIITIGIIGMLLLMSFSVFVVANEKSSGTQVTTSYSFEMPVIENVDIGGSVYDGVNMSGVPCGGNPGEPRLPGRGAYILLPQSRKVNSITVSPGEMVCLGSGFMVEPVGESVPLSEISSAPLPVPDEEIYNSADPFPGRLFTEVGTYGFRGYEILVLKLHPVQYVPITGELFYYPDLMVSVETVDDGLVDPLFRGLEKDRLEVMEKIDNPTLVGSYDLSTQGQFVPSNLYDLLIITTDSLKDGFEPLAQAHNASGVRTVIKTLSDIGGSTPEDIRDYIKDAYNNWDIEYVLLGGDHDIVPARNFYFGLWVDEYSQPHDEFGPSDLYYSGLDGPSTPPGDLYEPDGSGYYYAEADSELSDDDFVVGLFTPSLDLTGYSTVKLFFECNFDKYAPWIDTFGKINAYSGGTSLDNFEKTLFEVNSDYKGNITLTFDPSEYNDPSNVYIEFYYNNTGDPCYTSSFNIDDVCVKIGSKGINEERVLWETFEGNDFPPAGWTQVKYSEEGEWTQEAYRFDVDFLAEVFVGRACVGNAAEVENFVDKTIEYMNTDSSDPYLKKVLMAGEWLGPFCVSGGKRLNQLIGVCRKGGYTTVGFPPLKYSIDKLYDLNFLLQWGTFQIIKRINKNVHIINHNGHSDYHYNMRIYIPDVDSLTNDKYCFVYSVGCNAGGFDHGDCIAEHLTVKTSHGPFAGIWNARFGWFFSGTTDGDSERYHREFWDAVFDENITVISKANQDSKEDNIYRINEGYMRWVCYGLNLLGDPAVQFKYLGSESNQNSQQNSQTQSQSNSQQSQSSQSSQSSSSSSQQSS